MALLDASEQQRQEEREREEAARRKKLQQTRRQLALALLGLGIAVALALWAWVERKHAEKAGREAENARVQAEKHRLDAIVQALVAQPLDRLDERGALLVRQAYLFNARGQGHALHQIDAALRAVLDTRYFSHTLHFPNAALIFKSADAKKLVVADRDGTLRLWDLRQLNATPTVLHGPEIPPLSRLSLSPDGSALAMFSLDLTKIAPGSFGSQVSLWNLRQPQATRTGVGDGKEQFIWFAFSPDGQTLATASWPDIQRLLSSGFHSRVLLWDWQRPDTAPTVLDVPGNVATRGMAFSPDSQTLATLSPELSSTITASSAGTLRLWELRHLAAAPKVIGSAGALVVGLEFSADGGTLATLHTTSPNRAIYGGDLSKSAWKALGRIIQVRDLRQYTANPIVLHSPEALFSSMALGPEGQTLATGDITGSVRLWNLRQPDAIPIPLGTQEGQVEELMFSPDGLTLIAKDEVNTLRVWELHQSPQTFTILRSHTDAVSSLAFSPDGNTLVSGGRDHTVRLWDMRQPAATPTVLSDYNAPVLAVALSPDGQWLATGGLLAGTWSLLKRNFGDAVWLWNLRQSPPTRTMLSEPGGAAGSVAFSPDGQWLAATISGDIMKAATAILQGPANLTTGSVRLWDLHQPASDSITIDIPEVLPIAATFSADGQRLAISSMSGPVRLWDIQQRKEVFSFPVGSTAPTLSVAFSPDGQWLAAGSDDGTVRLWDMRRPEANPIVRSGDGVPVYAIAFSPDSQQLAAGSFNNVARLWNLHKLKADPIVLRGHDGPVFTVAFSPDGQRLATGSYDQTIRLWQVRTADLADQVCERVWRNLTLAEWRQFIGADLPYERTCPNLPLHPSVLEESEKLTRAGDVDGAVAFLQRRRERDPAVEINPHKQVALALVAQGKTLEKAGNLDGAHTLFEQARMLDSTVGLHPGAKTLR